VLSGTKNKGKGIVGLEIEAGSVAATEVRSNGSIDVLGYGVGALPPGVFRDGEVVDADQLAVALKQLFSQHKLSRNVRLGIANQRVIVRTLRLPAIGNSSELETAIRFQAVNEIPMPADQAILDWEVVGARDGANGERMMDVVVVAARRDMVSSLLGALEQAGLRPIGIDLSAFGMIRALGRQMASEGAAAAPAYPDAVAGGGDSAPAIDGGVWPQPAVLYCNLGDVTNLAVGQQMTCVFTRVSTFGVEGIAQKLAERRQLTLEHARQWVAHVGLESPVEELDGDSEVITAAREILLEGAQKLADELRRSLEFYGAQDDALQVETIVVCGPGTTIPGLVAQLERALGLPIRIGRPEALSGLDDIASARLTLPYGIALEE
jgi:type IV pilus assembly protein PilM